MAFHIASSEEVNEMTPNGGRRTIETGGTRQCFRRNTAVGVIESAVNRCFGKGVKNLLGSERFRRTAWHKRDEGALSVGSFPGFSVEEVGNVATYGVLRGFDLRLPMVITNSDDSQPSTSASWSFGLADVGPLANHVLAARADPDGIPPWWGEYANVGVGDELLAVAAVSHG